MMSTRKQNTIFLGLFARLPWCCCCCRFLFWRPCGERSPRPVRPLALSFLSSSPVRVLVGPGAPVRVLERVYVLLCERDGSRTAPGQRVQGAVQLGGIVCVYGPTVMVFLATSYTYTSTSFTPYARHSNAATAQLGECVCVLSTATTSNTNKKNIILSTQQYIIFGGDTL